MTIMIQDGEKLINHEELDFFLKGNTSLESASRHKPYEWIPDQGWKDLMRLMSLGEIYQNLANDVEKHGIEWRKWYD